MNREELEKEIKQIADYLWCNDDELVSEIMKLIPEVLKSVMLEKREENNHINLAYNNYWKYIKNKAKEQFNIDL
jgi:hypothetical protein